MKRVEEIKIELETMVTHKNMAGITEYISALAENDLPLAAEALSKILSAMTTVIAIGMGAVMIRQSYITQVKK